MVLSVHSCHVSKFLRCRCCRVPKTGYLAVNVKYLSIDNESRTLLKHLHTRQINLNPTVIGKFRYMNSCFKKLLNPFLHHNELKI